jgi:hypothetical protein
MQTDEQPGKMPESIPAAPGPELLHAGTYALYRTAAGGLHVTYTRTVATDDSGQQRAVEGAPAAHLPDIPPEAVPMLESFLANGFPPAVLSLLAGKLNPASIMRAMRAAGSNGAAGEFDNVG